MPQPFAPPSEPPCYAVIFASRRREGTQEDGYDETAARMVELAARQPGYLGVESARDADGFGITVSYWRDEASIAAWKRDAEHAIARAAGRARWYAGHALRVARVERGYRFGEAKE